MQISLRIVWDEEWAEHRVEYYEGSILSESKTYYCPHYDDAHATMLAMCKEAEEAGHSVNILPEIL